MATKSGQDAVSTDQVEELLDAVDLTLDRLKTLYEQYFLGIQKQAPAFIHADVERKLRDLTQISIRNTGLRYRLATLQQKFGSYNSYWRRTLRQIENGTYVRHLTKIGREAARTGSDIPEEILAAMPKRMREQVLRDRDQAIAIAKRRNQVDDSAGSDVDVTAFAPDETVQLDDESLLAQQPKRDTKTRGGAHVLSEDDGDIDFNALFSAFDDDAPKEIERARRASTRPPSTTQTPGSPQTPAPRPQMPRMPVPNTATPPLGSTTPAAPSIRPASSTPSPSSTTTFAPPRPMTQPPSAPVLATGPIPLAGPPTTQTSAIPRPVGQQASGPGQAIPRPVGQQPSGPAGMPRPPGPHQTPPVPVPATLRPPGPAQTGPVPTIPRAPGPHETGPVPAVPRPPASHMTGATQAIPRPVGPQASGPAQGVPAAGGQPGSGPTQGIPRPIGQQGSQPTGAMPRPPGAVPSPLQTGPVQVAPRSPTGAVPTMTQPIPRPAPSQQARPTPVMPGAAAQTGPVPVESMSGPFPRTQPDKSGPTPSSMQQTTRLPVSQQTTQIPTTQQTTQIPTSQQTTQIPTTHQTTRIPTGQQTTRIPTSQQTSQLPKSQQTQSIRTTQAMPKPPGAPQKPPPGMSEADVNALHAKYVKAKEMIGEKVDAGSREKLLKTINQTAPKIMEQYKASGVDFSVVVKDNQVVIKAKPKT